MSSDCLVCPSGAIQMLGAASCLSLPVLISTTGLRFEWCKLPCQVLNRGTSICCETDGEQWPVSTLPRICMGLPCLKCKRLKLLGELGGFSVEFHRAGRPSHLLPHPAISMSACCCCSSGWGWWHAAGGQSRAGNHPEPQLWCSLDLPHRFSWGHATPQ